MPTLFLSAPKNKTLLGNAYRDFNTILATGIGPDFGVYATLIGEVSLGMKAVVFDRRQRRRGEGTVANYTRKTKFGNGVWGYDVEIRDLKEVPYQNPPRVNRCGVAVI
jgi:hypothetical protein